MGTNCCWTFLRSPTSWWEVPWSVTPARDSETVGTPQNKPPTTPSACVFMVSRDFHGHPNNTRTPRRMLANKFGADSNTRHWKLHIPTLLGGSLHMQYIQWEVYIIIQRYMTWIDIFEEVSRIFEHIKGLWLSMTVPNEVFDELRHFLQTYFLLIISILMYMVDLQSRYR